MALVGSTKGSVLLVVGTMIAGYIWTSGKWPLLLKAITEAPPPLPDSPNANSAETIGKKNAQVENMDLSQPPSADPWLGPATPSPDERGRATQEGTSGERDVSRVEVDVYGPRGSKHVVTHRLRCLGDVTAAAIAVGHTPTEAAAIARGLCGGVGAVGGFYLGTSENLR